MVASRAKKKLWELPIKMVSGGRPRLGLGMGAIPSKIEKKLNNTNLNIYIITLIN